MDQERGGGSGDHVEEVEEDDGERVQAADVDEARRRRRRHGRRGQHFRRSSRGANGLVDGSPGNDGVYMVAMEGSPFAGAYVRRRPNSLVVCAHQPTRKKVPWRSRFCCCDVGLASLAKLSVLQHACIEFSNGANEVRMKLP